MSQSAWPQMFANTKYWHVDFALFTRHRDSLDLQHSFVGRHIADCDSIFYPTHARH
jgi:hypothetical protein